MRAIAHGIIENYIVDTKQYTKIENNFSSKKYIEIGVPQGTVLAPILFILYISDLPCSPINGKMTSYANDTKFCLRNMTGIVFVSAVDTELHTIHSWSSQNGLSLNTKKTK